VVPEVKLESSDVWHGRYSEDGTFTMSQTGSEAMTIADESQLVRMLEGQGRGPIAAVACTDDYQWWAKHGCTPENGKPLWLTQDDNSTHHIFFDDNIHNLAHDSIVAVRSRESEGSPFEAMSGSDTLLQHGVHLVRVPTLGPLLNHNWFVEKIEQCEIERTRRSTMA